MDDLGKLKLDELVLKAEDEGKDNRLEELDERDSAVTTPSLSFLVAVCATSS